MTRFFRVLSSATMLSVVGIATVASVAAEPPTSPSDHDRPAKSEKTDASHAQRSGNRVVRWRVQQAKDGKPASEAKMAFQIVPLLSNGKSDQVQSRVLMLRSDDGVDPAILKKLSNEQVIVIVVPSKGGESAAAGVVPHIQVHRHGNQIRVQAQHTKKENANGQQHEHAHQHAHHEQHAHHDGHEHAKHDADEHRHHGHDDGNKHDHDGKDADHHQAQPTKQIRLRVEVLKDADDGKGKEERRVIILQSGDDGANRQWQFIPRDGKVIQLRKLQAGQQVEVEVERKKEGDGEVKEERRIRLRALDTHGPAELKKKLAAELEKAVVAEKSARAQVARISGGASADVEKRLARIESKLDRLSRLVRELVEEVEEHQADDDDDDDD